MNVLPYRNLIRAVPDFPQPGVTFRDISPILANSEALQWMAEQWKSSTDLSQVDAFVGIESRGFVFASYLAAHYGKGIVLMRKAGKLPPPVISLSYSLEYGNATLEIAKGSGRVMIVDDVLATGGTLKAGIHLCEQAGYTVKSAGVLINLPALNQLKLGGQDIFSVYNF